MIQTTNTSDKKIVLFLTSAIDVNDIKYSVVNATDVRYKEYHLALMKWVQCTLFDGIIFCDNSGFDLTPLIDDVGNNWGEDIEFLSYNGQGFSRELGKGYGEICTFEYVSKKSKLFNNADLILKVNGRYFLKNYKQLVESLKKQDAEIIGNFQQNLTRLDSRVFAFSPRFFYEYFIFFKDDINDSNNFRFENALACAAHRFLGEKRKWDMLQITPVVEGRSGSTGRVYSVYGVRWFIKLLFHKLLRGLVRV